MVVVSAVTVFIALESQTHPCLGVFFHSTYHTLAAFRAHFMSPNFHFLPTFLISGERGGDRYEWSRGDRDRDGGRRRDDDRDRR